MAGAEARVDDHTPAPGRRCAGYSPLTRLIIHDMHFVRQVPKDLSRYSTNPTTAARWMTSIDFPPMTSVAGDVPLVVPSHLR